MMSWFSALSVGSFFQNVALYLFILFLMHANYRLITISSHKKRRTGHTWPGRKGAGGKDRRAGKCIGAADRSVVYGRPRLELYLC